MKKHLVAGLIILVPILLTIMLFIFLINIFTSPFLNLVIDFLKQFKIALFLIKNPVFLTIAARILIIIILCVFIFLLGVAARWFIFNSLINFTNKTLSKIPFVKSIYKALKDVTFSLINKNRKAFTKTAMIAFPGKDCYCVGFETGETPKECEKKLKQKLRPIWVPTSPHPLSSLLVLVPKDKIYPIEMKNEDAVKYIISCGLILPGEKTEDALKK